MPYSILIVEDDLTFATMLKTWLGKKGFLVDTAGNSARARKQLDAQSYNLVLSDLRLPDQDGISLLAWMKEHGHQIPLIIMTGYADIQSAVQAMKNGANDYISKPVQPDVLLKKINEALQNETVIAAPSGSAPSISIAPSSNFLEGESEAARQLYNYVGLVAPTPMSVLINGASGTGKEYVAHRIHQLSKRADKPFIAIDCGSIPKELAASEFFGHVKGSFTGALNDKTGAFVEANGGTLFLDEIGNLSYEVQIQLLRALQERRIRPVGSNKEIEVNVRLISATNENLQKAIEKAIEDYKKLGCEIVEISLPKLKYSIGIYYILATAECSSNLARFDGVKYGYRTPDAKNLLEMYTKTRAEGFGPEVKRRIMLGTYALSSGYYDAYYKKAQQMRALVTQDFAEAFKKVDILISPTCPNTAFDLGAKASDPLAMYLTDIATISANLAGIPGLSVPAGFDKDGMPIGLQILAPQLQESRLFNAAHKFERAIDYYLKLANI